MAAPLSGTVAVTSIVDSAGPGQPFFAPASGGGGGGSNYPADANFSSITMNPQGAGLDLGWDNTNTGAQLQFNVSTNGANGQLLQMLYAPSGGVTDTNGFSLYLDSFTSSAPSGNGTLSLTNLNFAPNYGANASGVIACGAGNQIYLTGVSSINGQTPGGGGAYNPNPSFSTVTTSTITVQEITAGPANDVTLTGENGARYVFDAPGGIANIQFYTTAGNPAAIGNNGSVMWIGGVPGNEGATPVSISSLNCSSINGAAPGGGGGPPPAVTSTISSLVNVSTINYGSPGVLQIAGGLIVSDNIGTGSISTLRLDSIVPGGSVSIPLSVLSTVSGDVSISTLTVSSINGASYPPPAGGMVFSSINIPGGPGSAFNADPNVITNVLTIPIIPNHVYSIDVNARVIANNAPTVTDTDNYYLEILANGGATIALDTAWGVQISSLTSGAIYTEVGGSGILKAPANPVSTLLLNILGSFSTTTRVDSFSYIDFGPI